MRVTDSQVHVWEADRPNRLWGRPREPGLSTPFTTELLLDEMKKADVDRVVLVPPGLTGNMDPNEYALKAARAYPDRFAVMGRIDPRRPDAAKMLNTWLSEPGMKGVRFGLRREPEARWISDGSMDWFWPQAARLGIPVAVQACGQLPLLQRVAESHPDLCLIVDHLGCPANGPDPLADVEQVLTWARYPNVFVKVSGLTRFTDEEFPYSSIHGYIQRAFESFGPHRLAWGSDYTTVRNRQNYRETVDLIRKACGFLSQTDREWILDGTIARVLKWEG